MMKTSSNHFPNFCAPRVLLQSLILGQLLVFVLLLSPLNKQLYQWENFALVSLFVQWLLLSSLGLLCSLKSLFAKLSLLYATLSSYVILLLNTVLVTEITWYFFMISPFNEQHQHFIFLLRTVGISAIISAILLRYLYVHQQAKLLYEAEASARLQALQARINPHFLFNSMNTIAELIVAKPQAAEQAVEDLADLFRATLNQNKRVTVGEELQLCQQYLSIENLRLQQRLQVEWVIDLLPKNALMPILCLQPLLENAIHYAIQPQIHGGTIHITGMTDNNNIRISVENKQTEKTEHPPHQGMHIALDNIRQRLQVYYGQQGRVEIKQDRERYQVSLCFPLAY